MPYVRRGSPIAVRVNYRRGFGDLASDCATGNAAACKDYYATVYSKAASVASTPIVRPTELTQAFDYPQAPGCHVVDLSANRCQMNDGTEEGCNAIQECDPLTGAVHFQYALPGGPSNPALPALKTLGVDLATAPSTNYAYAPNRALATPSGGTAFVPRAVQSNAPAPKVVTTPVPASSSNGAAKQATAVPIISALIDQVKNVATSETNWFDGIPNWLLVALGLGGTVLVARSFAR